jgi:hypothetical protein
MNIATVNVNKTSNDNEILKNTTHTFTTTTANEVNNILLFSANLGLTDCCSDKVLI